MDMLGHKKKKEKKRRGNLDHDADDALHGLNEDGLGALVGAVARAVADRVLRFDAEQEARREVVDVGHARLPADFVLFV